MNEYKCKNCGSNEFEQDMKETYKRYFNENGKIIDIEISSRVRGIMCDGPIVCLICKTALDEKIQKQILELK